MQFSFTYRRFNLDHDERLLRLFSHMRGEKLPEEILFLPPTGFVVFHEEAPVCIGFMIKCDNGMAINSDFLSDPELAKPLRQEAVEYMRSLLYTEAKRVGLQFVTCFTKHKKLAKRLEGIGFKKMDEGFTQLGRFLWL